VRSRFDNGAVDPQISVANDNSAVLSSDINLPPPIRSRSGTWARNFTLFEQDQRRRRVVSNYAGPGTVTLPPTRESFASAQRGRQRLYGRFLASELAGNNVARDGARAKFASPRTALSLAPAPTRGIRP